MKRTTGAIALLLALSLAGCGEVYEADPAFCSEVCFRRSIEALSWIDYETPYEGAIREIHAACEATSAPCCRAAGGRVSCPIAAPRAGGGS